MTLPIDAFCPFLSRWQWPREMIQATILMIKHRCFEDNSFQWSVVESMTVKQFCASQRQWRKILDDERKTRLIEFSNCLTMASCGEMATASPIYFIRENGWGYFNTGNIKRDVFPLLVMERMPLSFSQTMEYVTNNGENATLKPFTFVTKTYKQYLMYTNRRDFPSLSHPRSL